MAHLHLHPGRLHWLYQYRFALAISQAVTGVSEALRAEGPESAMGVRQEDAETGEGRGCGGVGLGGTGGTARKVGERQWGCMLRPGEGGGGVEGSTSEGLWQAAATFGWRGRVVVSDG